MEERPGDEEADTWITLLPGTSQEEVDVYKRKGHVGYMTSFLYDGKPIWDPSVGVILVSMTSKSDTPVAVAAGLLQSPLVR